MAQNRTCIATSSIWRKEIKIFWRIYKNIFAFGNPIFIIYHLWYNVNMNEIIIAIIGLIGSIIGGVFTYLAKTRKVAIEEAKREQQQSDLFEKIFEKFERVERRLDEHNNYAEKFGTVEVKIGSVEKTLLSISKDIEYMKQNNCYLNSNKSSRRID